MPGWESAHCSPGAICYMLSQNLLHAPIRRQSDANQSSAIPNSVPAATGPPARADRRAHRNHHTTPVSGCGFWQNRRNVQTTARAGTGRRIGDRHSFIFIELGGKKARQHAHRDMPFPGPGLICGRHTPNDGNTRFLIWPLMQPPVPRRPLTAPQQLRQHPASQPASQPARTTNRPRPEHTTLGFSLSRSLILTYHHTSLVHICKLTSSETNASRQQLHSPPST